MSANTDHPEFPQPSDVNMFVWRYLSFAKFVALLEERALYFATADTLGDPYEGATSHANRQLRSAVYADAIVRLGRTAEQMQAERDRFANLERDIRRQWTFVNCWHINQHESEAMWQLYVPDGKGVAIRTRYQTLVNALPEHVYVGLIRYMDYSTQWMPEQNSFSRYMHKRISFAHESEIRAMFFDRPTEPIPGAEGQRYANRANTDGGRNIQIDLEAFIENIFVAPTAPAWFRDVVLAVTRRYEIAIPIEHSGLGREPEF